jgi:hypothetical protein
VVHEVTFLSTALWMTRAGMAVAIMPAAYAPPNLPGELRGASVVGAASLARHLRRRQARSRAVAAGQGPGGRGEDHSTRLSRQARSEQCADDRPEVPDDWSKRIAAFLRRYARQHREHERAANGQWVSLYCVRGGGGTYAARQCRAVRSS